MLGCLMHVKAMADVLMQLVIVMVMPKWPFCMSHRNNGPGVSIESLNPVFSLSY